MLEKSGLSWPGISMPTAVEASLDQVSYARRPDAATLLSGINVGCSLAGGYDDVGRLQKGVAEQTRGAWTRK